MNTVEMKETAPHHPHTGRSQSVDCREEAQCWIGHEPAKLFQIVVKTAEKESVHSEE